MDESDYDIDTLGVAARGPGGERALARLVALAEEGHCYAIEYVGVLCWEGKYLPLDVRRALQLFCESAALGRGQGCYLAAAVYDTGGPDFAPNPAKAALFRARGHAMGVRQPGT